MGLTSSTVDVVADSTVLEVYGSAACYIGVVAASKDILQVFAVIGTAIVVPIDIEGDITGNGMSYVVAAEQTFCNTSACDVKRYVT